MNWFALQPMLQLLPQFAPQLLAQLAPPLTAPLAAATPLVGGASGGQTSNSEAGNADTASPAAPGEFAALLNSELTAPPQPTAASRFTAPPLAAPVQTLLTKEAANTASPAPLAAGDLNAANNVSLPPAEPAPELGPEATTDFAGNPTATPATSEPETVPSFAAPFTPAGPWASLEAFTANHSFLSLRPSLPRSLTELFRAAPLPAITSQSEVEPPPATNPVPEIVPPPEVSFTSLENVSAAPLPLAAENLTALQSAADVVEPLPQDVAVNVGEVAPLAPTSADHAAWPTGSTAATPPAVLWTSPYSAPTQISEAPEVAAPVTNGQVEAPSIALPLSAFNSTEQPFTQSARSDAASTASAAVWPTLPLSANLTGSLAQPAANPDVSAPIPAEATTPQPVVSAVVELPAAPTAKPADTVPQPELSPSTTWLSAASGRPLGLRVSEWLSALPGTAPASSQPVEQESLPSARSVVSDAPLPDVTTLLNSALPTAQPAQFVAAPTAPVTSNDQEPQAFDAAPATAPPASQPLSAGQPGEVSAPTQVPAPAVTITVQFAALPSQAGAVAPALDPSDIPASFVVETVVETAPHAEVAPSLPTPTVETGVEYTQRAVPAPPPPTVPAPGFIRPAAPAQGFTSAPALPEVTADEPLVESWIAPGEVEFSEADVRLTQTDITNLTASQPELAAPTDRSAYSEFADNAPDAVVARPQTGTAEDVVTIAPPDAEGKVTSAAAHSAKLVLTAESGEPSEERELEPPLAVRHAAEFVVAALPSLDFLTPPAPAPSSPVAAAPVAVEQVTAESYAAPLVDSPVVVAPLDTAPSVISAAPGVGTANAAEAAISIFAADAPAPGEVAAPFVPEREASPARPDVSVESTVSTGTAAESVLTNQALPPSLETAETGAGGAAIALPKAMSPASAATTLPSASINQRPSAPQLGVTADAAPELTASLPAAGLSPAAAPLAPPPAASAAEVIMSGADNQPLSALPAHASPAVDASLPDTAAAVASAVAPPLLIQNPAAALAAQTETPTAAVAPVPELVVVQPDQSTPPATVGASPFAPNQSVAPEPVEVNAVWPPTGEPDAGRFVAVAASQPVPNKTTEMPSALPPTEADSAHAEAASPAFKPAVTPSTPALPTASVGEVTLDQVLTEAVEATVVTAATAPNVVPAAPPAVSAVFTGNLSPQPAASADFTRAAAPVLPLVNEVIAAPDLASPPVPLAVEASVSAPEADAPPTFAPVLAEVSEAEPVFDFALASEPAVNAAPALTDSPVGAPVTEPVAESEPAANFAVVAEPRVNGTAADQVDEQVSGTVDLAGHAALPLEATPRFDATAPAFTNEGSVASRPAAGASVVEATEKPSAADNPVRANTPTVESPLEVAFATEPGAESVPATTLTDTSASVVRANQADNPIAPVSPTSDLETAPAEAEMTQPPAPARPPVLPENDAAEVLPAKPQQPATFPAIFNEAILNEVAAPTPQPAATSTADRWTNARPVEADKRLAEVAPTANESVQLDLEPAAATVTVSSEAVPQTQLEVAAELTPTLDASAHRAAPTPIEVPATLTEAVSSAPSSANIADIAAVEVDATGLSKTEPVKSAAALPELPLPPYAPELVVSPAASPTPVTQRWAAPPSAPQVEQPLPPSAPEPVVTPWAGPAPVTMKAVPPPTVPVVAELPLPPAAPTPVVTPEQPPAVSLVAETEPPAASVVEYSLPPYAPTPVVTPAAPGAAEPSGAPVSAVPPRTTVPPPAHVVVNHPGIFAPPVTPARVDAPTNELPAVPQVETQLETEAELTVETVAEPPSWVASHTVLTAEAKPSSGAARRASTTPPVAVESAATAVTPEFFDLSTAPVEASVPPVNLSAGEAAGASPAGVGMLTGEDVPLARPVTFPTAAPANRGTRTAPSATVTAPSALVSAAPVPPVSEFGAVLEAAQTVTDSVEAIQPAGANNSVEPLEHLTAERVEPTSSQPSDSGLLPTNEEMEGTTSDAAAALKPASVHTTAPAAPARDTNPETGVDDMNPALEAVAGQARGTQIANHPANAADPRASHPSTEAQPLAAQLAEPLRQAGERLTPHAPHTFRVHLSPRELGEVEIELTRDTAGQLHARMTVESDRTREVLRAELGHLRDTLEQAGWPVAQLDVSTGQSWTQQPPPQAAFPEPTHTTVPGTTNVETLNTGGPQPAEDRLLNLHA